MAKTHGSDLADSPVKRIAQRILAAHRLSPPIDVGRLAAILADVQYDEIPGTPDAILLYEDSTHPRPRIILKNGPSRVRQRFTLAHELGHLLLPWHIAALTYSSGDSDTFYSENGDLNAQQEREANEFASELLVPSAWLFAQVDLTKETPANLVKRIAAKCDVSPIVAALATIKKLPSGHALIEVSSLTGSVQMTAQSDGTSLNMPQYGDDSVSIPSYQKIAESTYDIDTSTGTIYWFVVQDDLSDDSVPLSDRSSMDILRGILSDAEDSESKVQKLTQRVSGVVGIVLSRNTTEDLGEILNLVKRALAGREYLHGIEKHEDFDEYLKKRCSETAEKRKKKRR